MLYPERIDHDVLFVEDRDPARKVVENETTRFDLQTGKSLVEHGCKSIVGPIMPDASAGRANYVIQHVMDFVIEIRI